MFRETATSPIDPIQSLSVVNINATELPALYSIIPLDGTTTVAQEDIYYATVESSAELSAISSNYEIIYQTPYLITEDNAEIGVSHLFYVKLNSASDVSLLEDLAEENNVSIMGEPHELMPLVYKLSCTNESEGNALEMANLFYETGDFDFAHPDFINAIRYEEPIESNTPQSDEVVIDGPATLIGIPNDYYFPDQYYLRNTGQDGGTIGMDINWREAGLITHGSEDVTIAVISTGYRSHNDVGPDFTFDTCVTDSLLSCYGDEGLKIMGIIDAATNNGIGLAGIAHGCILWNIAVPIWDRTEGDDASYLNVIHNLSIGFLYAASYGGAHVISCSWDAPDISIPMLEDVIDHCLYNTRGGKGSVVVFAAGNRDDPNSVSYHGSSNPDILTVGAACRHGYRYGSNYGDDLDIVAPGEEIIVPVKTSPVGAWCDIAEGSWFSAPQAAAVAGLVFSINPDLTRQEVVDIIEQTANPVHAMFEDTIAPFPRDNTMQNSPVAYGPFYVYSSPALTGRPNGYWNNEMGYGMLDAHAAVLAAQATLTE
jgi:hypothetical protein